VVNKDIINIDIMKNIICTLSFFMILLLSGCSSDDGVEAPGKFTEIGLESKSLSAGWESYSKTIAVKNGGWYIISGSITVNGVTTDFENETYLYSDDKVQDVLTYRENYEGEWFTVTKRGHYQLTVELKQNDTKAERKLIINLDGGNMIRENLTIVQKIK